MCAIGVTDRDRIAVRAATTGCMIAGMDLVMGPETVGCVIAAAARGTMGPVVAVSAGAGAVTNRLVDHTTMVHAAATRWTGGVAMVLAEVTRPIEVSDVAVSEVAKKSVVAAEMDLVGARRPVAERAGADDAVAAVVAINP